MRPELTISPLPHRLLRACVLALTCWVLSTPMATFGGSAAAAAGCLLVVLWADSRRGSQMLLALRSGPAMLLLAVLVALAVFLSRQIAASATLASTMGALPAYYLSEIVFWFALAGTTVWLLRLVARRYSWGAVPELLFVTCAFVITLAAHQRGMIDRPYFIGDFALIRGMDPSTILMGIGVAAVLTLTVLLMLDGGQRRLPYHFASLAVLCFSLLVYVQFFGMPTPSLTDDLGLTGQASAGGGTQSENPFQDGDNDASDREAPVAIVLFHDDYEPASGSYYFRESAYSEFNGRLLWTAERDDLDEDLVRQFPSSPVSVTEQIPAQHMRRRVRTTIGLLTPHRSPFGLDSPAHFEPAPNPNSLRFRQTYSVESLVPEFDFDDLIGRTAGSPDWTVAQWQAYLEMPDDPRYGEFARHLVNGIREEFADDPYAKAMAVKAWLDDNGIYSLKNEHAYATDPAASFLFGDVTGYCIHFSYAATYMFRSLGIPARVAIGYAVPAANRAGGSALLIQAVNGHAWPEIYLDGLGWVIVDPTPSQTLVDMSVDPQDSLQQMLADMLRDDEGFRQFLNEQSSGLSINASDIARALLTLAGMLLISAYLIRVWRACCPQWASAQAQYRVQFRAALDTLASHGIVRRHGESREKFARRFGDTLPALHTLTELHVSHAPGYAFAADGPIATAATDPSQWLVCRQQLKQQLRAHVPAWRRVLAVVHPVPWLYSR